jgi:SAM-dependent methyltransferase
MRIMKDLSNRIIVFIRDYLYNPLFFKIVYFRDIHKIKKTYGDFERLNALDVHMYTLYFNSTGKNICGYLLGEIVKIIIDLHMAPNRILLDGDNKSIIKQFKERFHFDSAEVLTVGIGNDFDYDWNFENDPPKKLPKDFDLIISQAMFEHLINPYKHFSDLVSRLRHKGIIIVQTMMPGFVYHRYPIDAIRFYPDWFETSADRLKLHVIRKFQRDFYIFYAFIKD